MIDANWILIRDLTPDQKDSVRAYAQYVYTDGDCDIEQRSPIGEQWTEKRSGGFRGGWSYRIKDAANNGEGGAA
tara:strand:+ start:953 stop:1174 length:222 start_codon:yes stop_codon:yes gene_type:complete